MGITCYLLIFAASLDKKPADIGWGGPDFVQYYVAWELIAEGKNPYDPTLAGPRQLAYGRDQVIETYAPPWSLLPALPVTGLPLPQAIIGFAIINLVLFVFCTLCWKSLLFPLSWRALPLMLCGVFFWLGTLALLGFGQISLWPFAGFTGWLYCTRRQRHVPAGLFLVLTIIKPHTALLPGVFAGIYSLRQRHWSTVAAFILGVLGATALTLWFRPTIWAEYLQGVRTGTSPMNFYTATLDGWLRVHFSESFRYLTWPLWLVAIAGTALIAWLLPRHGELSADLPEKEPLIAWSIVACLATVVFVPYGYSHDFVFMLPGFFVALRFWMTDRPGGRLGIAVWLVLYCLFMYLHLEHWTHDHYWIISWAGLATTIWLLRESLLFRAKPAEVK
jgi:hypothetical protein